jgi:nucleoside-diphosphate-sugar epimerase
MSILVAGGLGFIGSNLCKMLADYDIEHDVVDLKADVDICDFDASGYDVIVLLAADLGHNRDMYLHNLRIYEWVARQTAHIIYTSSAAVYGDSVGAHLEDEATPAPTLYGKSKLLGETIIKATHANYTIFRLANVFGSGDGNGAIDIFKRGGNKIFGVGDDVRDYISVRTVCVALRAVAISPSGYNQQVYNISSCKPMSTRQAFYEFGHGQPEYLDGRDFDVNYSLLDNTKATKASLL